jgi:hypothetical protein
MDWFQSELKPFINRSYPPISIVHFDCVDSPICPGAVFPDSSSLSKCEDLLGSVLWLEAIELFLPYLENELAKTRKGTALCLGEGTGAVGCALSVLESFEKVIITDLPDLVPLLHVNALLAGPKVEAIPLDWRSDLPGVLEGNCDVVIGCEVLYGNRFVWPNLLDTIRKSIKAPRLSVVYLCVTLRNQRHDLEDFKNNYLVSIFERIDEIPLSPSVSVLKAYS